MSFGTLIVKPLHAKLVLDEPLHRDLQIVVKCGDQKKKSPIFHKAGKNPKFDFEFEFKRTYEDFIHIEIWSKEEDETQDFMLGHSDIRFNDILNKHNMLVEWYVVRQKNREIGEIYIECGFMPEKLDRKTAPEMVMENFGLYTNK